jgi:PAS domain-containing protein
MTSSSSSPFVTKVLLRQSIGSVRLVIALFTVASVVIKLLYDRFLPELRDLNVMRWSIIALGCVFFATTFIRYKRGLVVTYFSFFLYGLTLLYVIAFAVMNQFDPSAVTILILVVGTSTVIMNSLLYYGIQAALILVAALFSFLQYSLGNANLIALLNLLIALGAFAIVVAVRLQLIKGVRDSQLSLEKLNVLAIVANKKGEIVFVSPTVQTLLGYKPNELLHTGWWREMPAVAL